MKKYTDEMNVIKQLLRNKGWQIVKDSISKEEDYSAQGVIYSNFQKGRLGLHIEYGDEDCVFGEVIEEEAAA
jgi:hypothetical protein